MTGYLTPDTLPADEAIRVLSIPNDEQFIANVSGALLALCNESAWTEYGTITPEQAANAAWEMVERYLNPMEAANTFLAGPVSGPDAPVEFRPIEPDDLIGALDSPPPIGASAPNTVSATSVLLSDGTETDPALTFTDDQNTGLYSPSPDDVALTSGGIQTALFRAITGVIEWTIKAVSGRFPRLQLISENSAGAFPAFLVLRRQGPGQTATPDNQTIFDIRGDGFDTGNTYRTFVVINATIGTNASGGAPTTLNIGVSGSGTSAVTRIYTASGVTGIGGVFGSEALRVNHTGTINNRLTVQGEASGGTPSLRAEGSDTNIDLGLATKGAGKLSISAPTSTTVGIPGSAAALPSLPTAYLPVAVGGTQYKIPLYTA